MVTPEELKVRQVLPLEDKITFSLVIIREWYEYWQGKVYVAFSGGKDSTVLLHLVRSLYPDVPAVFSNTGLEFPEIVQFVNTVPNVIKLRPRKTFRQVIQQCGYPVVSKKMAQYLYEVRNAKGDTPTKRLRLTGIKSDGSYSEMSKISNKWQYLVDAPFNISEKCCVHMKKYPAKEYSKKTGRMPFLGTMASEGKQREHNYLRYGCNAFDLASQPRSAPIAFWLEDDIWNYIRTHKVPFSKIYDMGYSRTGCVFCGFGAHLEAGENRFQRLKKTHPKLWRYCMDKLGIREVMQYCGVPVETKYTQLSLLAPKTQ